MNSLENYFLLPFKNGTDREFFLARLQLKFAIVSILFALGYWINTYFTGFIVARYLMLFSAAIFTLQLFGLRFGISRTVTSHIFVFICWAIIFVLALVSEGILSYVLGWVCLIPIMALLLLNPRSAWLWSVIGLLTILFFLAFDLTPLLPVHLLAPVNNLLISSLHIGLLFIILTITSIFDRQQVLLIHKISELYQNSAKVQEEVAAQNEELIQSQEEILAQRDLLGQQNAKLEEARAIIEKQHNEIKLRNENLELDVEKRTQELIEYNQQLEQFAFVSSHNLRAPVARILGLGQLLEMADKVTLDEGFVHRSLISTTRELDRVVKDLNTILEIKKNNTSVVTKINLEEEIKLIRINLEKEIAETNAMIYTDFSAVPFIQSIRPYIDSIFINLISNAIKYRHPKRTPIVKIKTELVNDYVLICIQDNGLGIDLSLYRDKLFTLYSRFHNHVEGKGLGLYLVKTQVTAMGGRIEVQSELQAGLTLKIYLKTSDNPAAEI